MPCWILCTLRLILSVNLAQLIQIAAGIFRLITGVCRTMVVSSTGGALTLLLVFLLGGFILPKGQIPNWLQWAYWVSPMAYGFNAFAVNEMYAPRWRNKFGPDNTFILGDAVLKIFNVPTDKNWYWIGAGALLGFTVLFNVLFTLSLMYFNAPGKQQAVISKETARDMEADQEETKETPRLGTTRSKRETFPQSLAADDGNNSKNSPHIMELPCKSNME